MPEEKMLSDEEYENVVGYKLAMGMADEMLERGIISIDEHEKIDQKMCEKYCINFRSIFRNIGRKRLDRYFV